MALVCTLHANINRSFSILNVFARKRRQLMLNFLECKKYPTRGLANNLCNGCKRGITEKCERDGKEFSEKLNLLLLTAHKNYDGQNVRWRT